MKLQALVAAQDRLAALGETLACAGPDDVDIAAVTAEAPEVKPGTLFAAVPGAWRSGPERVPEALQRGAVALLLPRGCAVAIPDGVALVTAANPRRALAILAARHAGLAQPEIAVAVTGTSGKTSTTVFARQLWTRLGHNAASLGTIGLVSPQWSCEVAITTPQPFDLHPALAILAADGVDRLALEASSHGLHQHRLDAMRLAAAAFTNLSRDHLNYHGTMEAYFAAKQRLFADLLPSGAPAVVNIDSEPGQAIAALARGRRHDLIRVGRDGIEIRLLDRRPAADRQRLDLELFGRRAVLDFPVIGGFQAENLLLALGLVIGTGAPVEATLDQVAHLAGVRGRIEPVATTPAGGAVYIDYAHKPAALEAVLGALRPHATGRVFVLFGCGGGTDVGKRSLMGAVAARLADRVILSDDNPRCEDPARIRAAIREGAPDAMEIGDRAMAIRTAMRMLDAGDLLVIAGKGHETEQIVGDEMLPFNDAEVARAIAAELREDGAPSHT